MASSSTRGQRAGGCVPLRGISYTAARRGHDKHLSSVFCLLPSERGISLIELIIFIVIVSVASAGVMLVMNTTAMYSADPLVHKQALAVAESLLEEIELQGAISGVAGGSPAIRANRTTFNDVMDYNGFVTTGVYPANDDGVMAAVSGLQNYNVAVAVSAVQWGNIPSASAVQITVAVTDPSGQSLEAIGYRVAY